MTKLTYICKTHDGKRVKVNTLAEARAIQEKGSSYTAHYVPIKSEKLPQPTT